MLIVTGGAGFIGSMIVWALNRAGESNILIADELGADAKWKNLRGLTYADIIHKDQLFQYLNDFSGAISGVFHMGACSTTTETNVDYLLANNIQYSQRLWQYAAAKQIPLIYASSGATYGLGERGFSDAEERLMPINPYGYSKARFDQWALRQTDQPSFWAGVKFFNVYGPNEYHKGGQASVVYHGFNQICASGQMRLFRSTVPTLAHGEQRRDFVYVKDCVDVMLHMFKARRDTPSGIYNIGTGTARTFIDLANALFAAMNRPLGVEWIDMPESLRAQYQNFTEASLDRLRGVAGYSAPFSKLEDGIRDYVQNYLLSEQSYASSY